MKRAGTTLLIIALTGMATTILAQPATKPAATAPAITRIGDGPIIRPEMMSNDDGEWSGNINFPSVIRVPAWIDKPLGTYYLYFSAHHGSYIRLAYADQIAGPWKIYEPGTLRLEQVETVNGSARTTQRHVASPDVHVDDEHKQIRMYFHYYLPKFGHKGSVATSADGLKFDPKPGVISGPYLRVIRHKSAWLGIDDQGTLLRSPDGLQPFEPISQAVKTVATDAGKPQRFRHGVLLLDNDRLTILFTRTGDAPERILMTRVPLTGAPAEWQAERPSALLAPEKPYEGSTRDLAPSTIMGQTNVRQLRDPYLFQSEGRTFLFYAVAGETGIAVAEVISP